MTSLATELATLSVTDVRTDTLPRLIYKDVDIWCCSLCIGSAMVVDALTVVSVVTVIVVVVLLLVLAVCYFV